MYIPSVLLVSFLLVLALPILIVVLVPAFLLYPLSNPAFVAIYLICVNVCLLDLAPVIRRVFFILRICIVHYVCLRLRKSTSEMKLVPKYTVCAACVH